MAINDIVAASHFFVSRHVKAGATVVDATAGNGYDTLFLARLIGEEGRVHAFDVQQKALDNTRALLAKNSLEHRVSLYLESHSNIPLRVSTPVQAVMFNLGTCPEGREKLPPAPRRPWLPFRPVLKYWQGAALSLSSPTPGIRRHGGRKGSC